MKARALLVALAAGLSAIALADWPAPQPIAGCTREVVEFLAFVPHQLQVDLADAGFPITPKASPYLELRARAWDCGDAGMVLPRMPRVMEHFRPDLLKVVTACGADAGSLCPTSDDGGEAVSPMAEAPFACACSSGSLCSVSNPDGGAALTAPTGTTLGAGSWSGSGCKPKPCGEIWLTIPLSDGGTLAASSWPPACPL